jgi:hypothetical protein
MFYIRIKDKLDRILKKIETFDNSDYQLHVIKTQFEDLDIKFIINPFTFVKYKKIKDFLKEK